MSVTSDSDPVDQGDNSSDALLDSPKATSPLLKQGPGAGGGRAGIKSPTSMAQRHAPHVLIRQKASYKNSVDI